MTTPELIETLCLRHGDRALILAQRLLEMVAHAPEIEEDMALSNLALDLIGQTRVLYTYAGQQRAKATGQAAPTEDDYAYWRPDTEFTNPLLVELPNRDFAHVIARQYLHDAYAAAWWHQMRPSTDDTLRALADRAAKETDYHLRHSRSWLLRLGDGTAESHDRMVTAIDATWRFTGELFETDEVDHSLADAGITPDIGSIQAQWLRTVAADLAEATVPMPDSEVPMMTGGRQGQHTENFSYLIGEMQVVARAHPGAQW